MKGLTQKTNALINRGTYSDEKSVSEINNNCEDKKNSDTKMVTCPVCGSRMREEGKARVWDFLNNREKRVPIYYCGRCGYRSHWQL